MLKGKKMNTLKPVKDTRAHMMAVEQTKVRYNADRVAANATA